MKKSQDTHTVQAKRLLAKARWITDFWETELEYRLSEIESREVEGVSASDVEAELRRVLA